MGMEQCALSSSPGEGTEQTELLRQHSVSTTRDNRSGPEQRERDKEREMDMSMSTRWQREEK